MDTYVVTIAQEEYRDLIECKQKYVMLVNHILESSRLSYDNKELYYEGDMSRILQLLQPFDYKDRLNELKKEKEEKKNATTSE